MLAFHGGGSRAEVMVRFCGLNELSDRKGFVVAYPNGSGRVARARSWNGGNCCGFAARHRIDDIKFVDALLNDLQATGLIDAKRVFATGMSNGGMLCYRLASELSTRIAAIAPVAGPMGTLACHPARPVSVCHFHGTRDEFTPYDGGQGERNLSRANFYSVQHGIRCWVAANGCDSPLEETRLPSPIKDGTHVRLARYGGGRAGSEVLLYTIEGMGHCWPGRRSEFTFLGTPTGNLIANDVMWEFFRRHAMSSESGQSNVCDGP